jgi:nitroreductase
MYDLEQVIGERRSTRMFLPHKPVPRELVDEALAVAVRAPSNFNIQPWHMAFASGCPQPPRHRPARRGQPHAAEIPPPPEAFAHIRRELVAQIYGSMGIARKDTEARWGVALRNWEFFRAPLAGIVCIHRDLGPVDCLGVGMFLQTLVLAFTARGLGTCVQASIAGYPEIIHKQLDIPVEYSILCGLAVGYADQDFPANQIRTPATPSMRTCCSSTTNRRRQAHLGEITQTTASCAGRGSRASATSKGCRAQACGCPGYPDQRVSELSQLGKGDLPDTSLGAERAGRCQDGVFDGVVWPLDCGPSENPRHPSTDLSATLLHY